MYFISDDPANDYERYLDSLPKSPRCDCCGEMVGEAFWEIGGDKYCEECIRAHRHYTDEYLSRLMEA